ncbi:hypothetical protein LTR37_018273 [Vermiconidia calcicola]|uniref:Uncharacterized protein n=1 Tax=Vermiconidia calcicola TaxID=1690605 RepID=A0ACC3MHF3_9PEZI|nr:hypothetical protein LTR37_018273 [Vermiconidia calcicola]
MDDYKHDRNGSMSSTDPFGNGSMDMQQGLLGWENGMENGLPSFQMPSMGMSNSLGAPEFALDPAFYNDPSMAGFDAFDPMSASTGTMMENKLPPLQNHSSVDTNASPPSTTSRLPKHLTLPFDLTSCEPSLDQQVSSNSQIVGLSGESDPYLLARYRFDQYNEATFQSIRIRKMNDGLGTDNDIPTFFTIQHNALASKAQPPESPEALDRYRRDVEEMVSDAVGKRLIRLFYKYVQPYFPVLSREGGSYPRDEDGCREPSSISTCLLAAIYGHALPFCAWDEKLCVEVYTPPSADALFKIAWQACLPNMHTPSFAVLQTLLLMVQRRPTNKHVSDTPFKSVLMSAAVSIAQVLGINRDPSAWPLPAWEIKQRRRLAWATYIQDKWLALNAGRTGYIQRDDWDVEMLTEEDFSGNNRNAEGLETPARLTSQHFIKLCELSELVDEILRGLFSVKATKALHNSLEATLEVAKPLRIRLTEWYQSLPAGLLSQPSVGSPDDKRRSSLQHELDGKGSLHLAYITAKIELFRAMLRPRVTDTNANAVSALRTGALAVAKEVFEFLEGLNARELEAFWASYARTNFTIASSFMLLLFVTSPNVADAKECLALLKAWRSLLRIKSRSCDLLNLALLRLDGVFVAGIDRLLELSPSAAQAWNTGQGTG